MAINRQESIASQGDHLLIILDKKEPQMVDQIRKEYPDLKVTYIAAEKLVQVREDEVPKGLYSCIQHEQKVLSFARLSHGHKCYQGLEILISHLSIEALEEATIVAYLPFNDILRPERCPKSVCAAVAKRMYQY